MGQALGRGALDWRVLFLTPRSGEDAGILERSGSIIEHLSDRSDRSRVSLVEPEPHLRVLIANEKRDRLELLAQVVTGLGHEVIAREIYVKEVGAVTARERPDLALVGLGLHSEHALDLIGEIVREAACPVIALLSPKDPAYVHEAAKRGIFAYILHD